MILFVFTVILENVHRFKMSNDLSIYDFICTALRTPVLVLDLRKIRVRTRFYGIHTYRKPLFYSQNILGVIIAIDSGEVRNVRRTCVSPKISDDIFWHRARIVVSPTDIKYDENDTYTARIRRFADFISSLFQFENKTFNKSNIQIS